MDELHPATVQDFRVSFLCLKLLAIPHLVCDGGKNQVSESRVNRQNDLQVRVIESLLESMSVVVHSHRSIIIIWNQVSVPSFTDQAFGLPFLESVQPELADHTHRVFAGSVSMNVTVIHVLLLSNSVGDNVGLPLRATGHGLSW
jgi:hypothetical protein